MYDIHIVALGGEYAYYYYYYYYYYYWCW